MMYLRLFFDFFKIGLFSVGGGMATIPFLYELSDKTGWISHQDLANKIAVGESPPGPIGVNMATYVGYISGMQQGGTLAAIAGAIIATLGLVAPSIIVILIIASFLNSFRKNRFVDSAFYGLRPASTALITAAGVSVAVSNLFNATVWAQKDYLAAFNWKGIVLAAVLIVLTNVVKKTKKLHPIVFIGLSAVVGIVFQM